MWVTDLHSLFVFSLAALPTGSKIEDLLTLASQDIEPVTDESMEDKSTSFLHEHQKLMLQHFGNMDTAILPDHVAQHMLLGVSISYLYSTPFLVFKPWVLNLILKMRYLSFSQQGPLSLLSIWRQV